MEIDVDTEAGRISRENGGTEETSSQCEMQVPKLDYSYLTGTDRCGSWRFGDRCAGTRDAVV